MAASFLPNTGGTGNTGYDPVTGQANYSYAGGAFGSQPGAVPVPQPAAALGAQIPGLTGLNSQASGILNNELMGNLSPDTKRAIQDAVATQSAASGMPGSNAIAGTLGGNRMARDFGMTSQQLQSQGLKDYSSFVPTVSSTQTVNPAVEAEINTQNAINAAAPNPAAAASYAQGLFQSYLSQLNQPVRARVPSVLDQSNQNGSGWIDSFGKQHQGHAMWGAI